MLLVDLFQQVALLIFVINSARDGSSAAVCSSRSKIEGCVKVAINSESACRSPPESIPTFAFNRFSRFK